MNAAPLKVALNGMLLGGHVSGVETCILHLAQALAQYGHLEYVLYVPRNVNALTADGTRVRTQRVHIPGGFRPLRILWEQLVLPARLRRDGATVLHAPGYVGSLAARVPVILTIYDLIALRFPQWCRLGNRLHYRLALPLSARKARVIIVPSDATRSDLVRHLGVPEDRIRTIPPGIDEHFSSRGADDADARVLERYRIRSPYILFVGNLEPKKNLGGLVRAFHTLRTAGHIEHQLVIAGRPGWGYAPVFQLVRHLGLEGEIVFTGFVPDEALPAIYRRAGLFVFPSWYEGFGLPPLEAMACGVPVIVSNRGALPESAGPAALTVDPDDPTRWAQAMGDVLKKPDLRQQLIRRGMARARLFTWRRTAEATEKVYLEVSA